MRPQNFHWDQNGNYYMKRIFKILLVLFSLLFIFVIWLVEKRNIYCIGGNKCITVWKHIGGKCDVIPGKYFGITRPSSNFIQTTNANNIDFYWCELIPNKLIVRSEQDCKIINMNKEDILIIPYDTSLRLILYGNGEKRHDEVNGNVNLMGVNIKENYAIDCKTGIKL